MPSAPEDPLEREFRSLVRKLDAARGFCFVVFFVEDRRASRQLQSGLATHLQLRGRSLVVASAETAFDLVTCTLSGIFEAPSQASGGDGRPVVWAEAFCDRGAADWDAQRRLLLMRMNERRSRFESELGTPLILLLPAGQQRDAASLAPDLWHVRLHSGVLSIGRTAADADWLSAPDSLAVTPAEPDDADGAPPPEVVYWHALRGAGPVAGGIDSASDVDVPLHDGFAAVRAWLRAGRVERAIELARELVDLARARLDGTPIADSMDGTGRALRRVERAAALREWGEALARAGRLDEAIAALEESVAFSADLVGMSDVASSPTRSHAGLALLSLGGALLRSGRAAEAGARFAQSLELIRGLARGEGGHESQVVAVLHSRVGDAATALKDGRRAIAAYQESVALWRHLRGSSGDDPSRLRSLAAALRRLGDAEWADGQGERASTAYREALALRQHLASRHGDVEVDALELGVLAARLIDAGQEAGHTEAAAGRQHAPHAPK